MLAALALAALVPAAEPAPAPADLGAYVTGTPRCDAAVPNCFGLHLHLVVTPEGPVQTVEWVSAQVAAANARFSLIDVAFEVVAADPLPAGDLEIDDRDERDALGDPRFSRGVAHAFVVGRLADVDIEGNEIRGVHWRYRPDRTRRWVILSKIAPALVLTHELGHFFGLPHSKHELSVMNKTEWTDPSLLTFAPPELERMRRKRDTMLRSGMLKDR